MSKPKIAPRCHNCDFYSVKVSTPDDIDSSGKCFVDHPSTVAYVQGSSWCDRWIPEVLFDEHGKQQG